MNKALYDASIFKAGTPQSGVPKVPDFQSPPSCTYEVMFHRGGNSGILTMIKPDNGIIGYGDCPFLVQTKRKAEQHRSI